MRILICTGILPPEPGGPATYTKLISTALSKRGHDIVIITYVSRKSKIQNPKSKIIQITRSWFKPWHYFKYFLAARRYGRNTDILYAQDPVSAGYPAFLASKLLKKPLVVKITGDYSWEQAYNRGLTDKLTDEFQNLPRYPSPINRIRDIQIRVCREAAAIITPAQYLKRLIAGWGVKEGKISVIYNSVPTPADMPRGEIRALLGCTDEDFLVVTAGRPVRWKGFEEVEDAVKDMQSNEKRLKFKVIQDEPHETVLQCLKDADAFVLNSGYEGLSHLVLEAMVLGTPVITTNVGGNPEIIENGKNGILVDYNEKNQLKQAITRLYEDVGLRKRLSENGKRTFERFQLDDKKNDMILQTEGVLKSCVS